MPCFFEGQTLIHVFTTATAQPDATVKCHCGCTRYQQIELEAPEGAAPAGATAPFDFAAHLRRQREFSERTFGPGARTQGVVDHIRKELTEILAKPDDLSEWADVVILGLDGFWRAGASPEQIIAALVAKQTKNEGRKWPDWRTAPAGKAIEHDRSSEAAPAVSREAEGAPASACECQCCPHDGSACACACHDSHQPAEAERDRSRLPAWEWQPMETAKQDGRAIIGLTWDNAVIPVFWSPVDGWKHCGDGWRAGAAPRLVGWQPLPPAPTGERE
jgi:hypothetical protein